MKNADIVLEVLKAYLRGGAQLELDSDFGRGYVRALTVALEEAERLEKLFCSEEVKPNPM
jgi:hypothetical protein